MTATPHIGMNTGISRFVARSQVWVRKTVARLTKTTLSRISRANRPVLVRLGLIGSILAEITGTYLPHSQAFAGQRSTTREADLSTQQTRAQAPSWIPRTSGDPRWPQGSRCPPCPRPQAPERLNRPRKAHSRWND